MFFQPGHIGDNGGKSVFVILFHHHVDEFAVVGNAVFDVFQRQYDAFQQLALFADVLGALGVVPQFWVFGQADHFFQAFFFALVIHIGADVGVALRQVVQLVVQLVDLFGLHMVS